MEEKRIQDIADALQAAVNAYNAGNRINDSMTFEEAKLLNHGRRMAELIGRAATRKKQRANIVDASAWFKGDNP